MSAVRDMRRQQTGRPRLTAAGGGADWMRECLRDAIDHARSWGQPRMWAIRRLAERCGETEGTVRTWLRDGVPWQRRREVLFDAAHRVVREARVRSLVGGGSLRAFRRHYGLRQQDLAAEMGVDQNTVSEWERGVNVPSDRLLGALADAVDSIVQRGQ